MSLRNRFAVPIALAGALLLPAVPAAADDDDDHERGHRGHYRGHDRGHDGHRDNHRGYDRYRGHGGHGHRHHRGCGHGGYYAPRYVVKNHYHGYPVHHYGYAPAAYCGPCGNHYDSYDDLSYHVHHHHHIAALAAALRDLPGLDRRRRGLGVRPLR